MKIVLPDTQPILIGAHENLFVALSPRWLNFLDESPDPVLTECLWPPSGDEVIAAGSSDQEAFDNPPSSTG